MKVGEKASFLDVGDYVLYGKHPLINGERYDTFNFDATGDGYLLDHLQAWTAGDYRNTWAEKRKMLVEE